MTDQTARHRVAAPSRGSRLLRVFGICVLALVMVVGLSGVYFYRHLNGNLTVTDVENQLHDRPEEGPTGALNVLVMGSDSRDGEGNNIDGLSGGGQRSDTTLLFHLSADRESAYGVSIPRDSMVDRPTCYDEDGNEIPGADPAMFNSAFEEGGPACTIQTVEQLTGVHVNHYVVVDFSGFEDMVDALDGVEVCLPEEVSDPAHDIYLEAGTQDVSGREALNYVRERHMLSANGDIGRMKRQQAFLASMANEVVSAGTLARPDRLLRFLNAATKSLEVDPGLGELTRMAGLGNQFRGIGLDNIKFITVPFAEYEPDPNRLVWTEDAKGLWRAMRGDTAPAPEYFEEAITAEKKKSGKGKGRRNKRNAEASPSTDADVAAANGLCA